MLDPTKLIDLVWGKLIEDTFTVNAGATVTRTYTITPKPQIVFLCELYINLVNNVTSYESIKLDGEELLDSGFPIGPGEYYLINKTGMHGISAGNTAQGTGLSLPWRRELTLRFTNADVIPREFKVRAWGYVTYFERLFDMQAGAIRGSTISDHSLELKRRILLGQ